MKLFYGPTLDHFDAINSILANAAPVKLTVENIQVPRPAHLVSSWRALVCYVMYEVHGVPQRRLAEWFNIHTTTVNSGVAEVRRTLSKGGREAQLIEKITEEQKKAAA